MSDQYSVNVLLFASYAEMLGARSVRIRLDEGSTVADLESALRRLPGADRLPERLVVAVNYRYADATDLVREGDEVAVIPPVAGG